MARTKGENKVIKPGKDLIASRADNFRKRLLKIVEERIREIDIDFASVKTVDSVGLGVIIAAHNTLKNAGGKLRLINVPEKSASFLRPQDWINILWSGGQNEH